MARDLGRWRVAHCCCLCSGPWPVGELGLVSGGSASEVLDGFGPGAVVAIQGEAALGPPQCLAVVVRLLLADGHLPVGLQQWHLPHLARQACRMPSISASCW